MKYIRAWWLPSLWMVVIFLFSSRERVSVNQNHTINFLFFKTLHVIEYAVLFVLYRRALLISVKKKFVILTAVAFVLTIIYAISDELHQTFVPTREGRPRDVIIDAAGAGLSWIFLLHVLPKMPKRLRLWAKNWQIA